MAFWMEGVKGAVMVTPTQPAKEAAGKNLRGMSALRNMARGCMVNMATNRFTPSKVRMIPIIIRPTIAKRSPKARKIKVEKLLAAPLISTSFPKSAPSINSRKKSRT